MVWEPDYEGNGLECDQLGDKVTWPTKMVLGTTLTCTVHFTSFSALLYGWKPIAPTAVPAHHPVTLSGEVAVKVQGCCDATLFAWKAALREPSGNWAQTVA